MGEKIRLRDPEHEGLSYGPNNEVQFGLKGGFPPGEVVLDKNDPMVEAILRDEPHVVVVAPQGETEKLYVCPVHEDKEFKTRNALLSHLRAKGHDDVIAPPKDEDGAEPPAPDGAGE